MVQKFCTPHNTNVFAMRFAEAILETQEMLDQFIHNFENGREYLLRELDTHSYRHKGEAGKFFLSNRRQMLKIL